MHNRKPDHYCCHNCLVNLFGQKQLFKQIQSVVVVSVLMTWARPQEFFQEGGGVKPLRVGGGGQIICEEGLYNFLDKL